MLRAPTLLFGVIAIIRAAVALANPKTVVVESGGRDPDAVVESGAGRAGSVFIPASAAARRLRACLTSSLFAFGHGLSYTRFAVAEPKADDLPVSVDVTLPDMAWSAVHKD